ncbi:hypothetical protein Tco_1499861 [Tanacetum coccineum]
MVCHEKVVRIPLEGDEILWVHGECTQGVVKTLMNTKSKEEHEVHLKSAFSWSRGQPERIHVDSTKSEAVRNWMIILRIGRKGRVKSRRVRGMILAAQSEAFKQENVLTERLHGLDQEMERKADESLYFMDQIWVPLVGSVMDVAHASRLGWMIYLVVLVDAAESVRDMIGFEYCLASSSGWTNSALVRKQHLSYRESLAKSSVDYRHSLSILEGIGRECFIVVINEELNSVHDTFHVSNMKKCLADASLHVPLNEIKIDNTLRFVEEPVKIMDREVKSLKRSRIPLVKVRWNSKRSPEFTWEREDYMKSKYPQLFVDRAVEPTS